MSIIVNTWLLRDFCLTHGRVIPHDMDKEGHFTEFHCADKRHDDSETIICSDEQGVQLGTLAGILSMQGHIVEFNDKKEYLFCTESELNKLKRQSEKEQEEMKESETKQSHPARPQGIKITAEKQDRRFKSYHICPDYKVKIHYARTVGYLTPPYSLGDYSYQELVCKDDCIFPNCPFYDLMHLDELRYNHRADYDTWVVQFSKNAPGLHSNTIEDNHSFVEEEKEILSQDTMIPQNNIKVLSSKPLRQLIVEQNSELKQLYNHKTGNTFFVCGNVRGYISPAAVKKLEEKDASVDDFKIALVAKEGENAIPCLLLSGDNRFKLVRTFEVRSISACNSSCYMDNCDDDLPF